MQKRALFLVLMLLVCASALAQTPDLTAQIRASEAMVRDLRDLCDHIGGRVSGSPQSAEAVKWAAKRFREAGADTVRVEAYTLPAYWRSRTGVASCLAPAEFPLRIAAAPLTAS